MWFVVVINVQNKFGDGYRLSFSIRPSFSGRIAIVSDSRSGSGSESGSGSSSSGTDIVDVVGGGAAGDDGSMMKRRGFDDYDDDDDDDERVDEVVTAVEELVRTNACGAEGERKCKWL